VGYCVALIGR